MNNSCGFLRIYENDNKDEPVFFPPLKQLQKRDTSYYRVLSFIRREVVNIKLPKSSKCENGLLPLSLKKMRMKK